MGTLARPTHLFNKARAVSLTDCRRVPNQKLVKSQVCHHQFDEVRGDPLFLQTGRSVHPTPLTFL